MHRHRAQSRKSWVTRSRVPKRQPNMAACTFRRQCVFEPFGMMALYPPEGRWKYTINLCRPTPIQLLASCRTEGMLPLTILIPNPHPHPKFSNPLWACNLKPPQLNHTCRWTKPFKTGMLHATGLCLSFYGLLVEIGSLPSRDASGSLRRAGVDCPSRI